MGTLASVIKNRFEFYNSISQFPSKTEYYELDEKTKLPKKIKEPPSKPTKEQFEECKKYIDSLSKEFAGILKTKANENKVIKSKKAKGYEFSYTNKRNGIECELNVFENEQGEIKSARYIAYWNNQSYIRNLLLENPLSAF